MTNWRVNMNKIIEILKMLKNYTMFVVIAVLLIIIYFKSNSIQRLRTKLAEKPKIEYVYNTKTDTIIQKVVEPKTTIVYKDKHILIHDTLSLTNADSAQIAEAYASLYTEYHSKKIYDDVLKDDSLAYIKLYEEVSQNAISNRKLEYQDKTPVIKITNTVTERKFSIIGGLEAGDGVKIGTGVVTNKNAVFTIAYDPFKKEGTGSVYLPIFTFKR